MYCRLNDDAGIDFERLKRALRLDRHLSGHDATAQLVRLGLALIDQSIERMAATPECQSRYPALEELVAFCGLNPKVVYNQEAPVGEVIATITGEPTAPEAGAMPDWLIGQALGPHHLARMLMDTVPLSDSTANRVVKAFTQAVGLALLRDCSINFHGIGRLKVNLRHTDHVRSPQTGAVIPSKGLKVVSFDAAPRIRRLLNAPLRGELIRHPEPNEAEPEK